MNIKKMRRPTFLEVVFFLLLACFIAYNGQTYLATLDQSEAKQRDAVRISDIDQIQSALLQYYTDNNSTYPTCLYKKAGCTTALEGSREMPIVPSDAMTHVGYGYSAYGSGKVCTGYHLGTSLERTGSQALLTGSDAPPETDSKLCIGSAQDFSGLSYAKGGQPCNTLAGTAQPTDSADGETCYDIARHRPR